MFRREKVVIFIVDFAQTDIFDAQIGTSKTCAQTDQKNNGDVPRAVGAFLRSVDLRGMVRAILRSNPKLTIKPNAHRFPARIGIV